MAVDERTPLLSGDDLGQEEVEPRQGKEVHVEQEPRYWGLKRIMVVFTSFFLIFTLDGSLYSNDVFGHNILKVSGSFGCLCIWSRYNQDERYVLYG